MNCELTENRWHEHDPLELISSVEKCIDGAVAAFEKQGHNINSIKAVGITNQRETTVVWNSETGEPLYNAIVWTDTRTQALVRKLKTRLGSDKLQDLCGLPLSTYPSVGKLLWLLENEPKVKDAYEKGVLAFGTVDAWLVFKLNGGPKKNVFVSDPSNASRTMFMNLKTLKYDDSLIDFFRLDTQKVHLPEIVRSSDTKAVRLSRLDFLEGLPYHGLSWRPVCRASWAERLHSRYGQEHLWYRLLLTVQRWRRASDLDARFVEHSSL